MPLIASQTIASGFGTYHQGDHIDLEAVPGGLIEAWLAAGVIEEAPVEPEETVVEEKPAKPAKAKVEKAVKPPKTSGRLQTEKTVQKRFEQATDGPGAG